LGLENFKERIFSRAVSGIEALVRSLVRVDFFKAVKERLLAQGIIVNSNQVCLSEVQDIQIWIQVAVVDISLDAKLRQAFIELVNLTLLSIQVSAYLDLLCKLVLNPHHIIAVEQSSLVGVEILAGLFLLLAELLAGADSCFVKVALEIVLWRGDELGVCVA